MEANKMKILAIDDNRDTLTSLEAVAMKMIPGINVLTAQSGPRGLDLARDEDPDVILLDIVMPDMDGFSVCRILKEDERLREIPVLFLTGLWADRESRLKALEVGGEGFLAKPFDMIELIAQVRAMAKIKAANRIQRLEKERLAEQVAERTRTLEQELTKRQRAEELIKQSELRYRRLFESAKDGILILEYASGKIVDGNPYLCELLGFAIEEILEKRIWEIGIFKDIPASKDVYQRLQQEDYVRYENLPLETKNGKKVEVEFVSNIYLVGRNKVIQCNIRDITERKRAEEEKKKLWAQLLQAQKMESVGQLAGGVAHDFNNMLGVILGHAEMALERVDPTQPLFADLQEIRKAGKRSADLIRQLLAFARKQTIAPRVLNLNETVEGMLKMLQRLIGEDIDLAWRPGAGPWPVNVDPSQIDQILVNLCVNARDAITNLGKVTIETTNATFDEAYCEGHQGFTPGHYVLLAVSDNGRGMDKETQGKIFEPFFTTKATGKGTGLGLATVYGIVKQNNGFINVYSEPEKGTTFKIYLPRHAAKKEKHKKQVPPARDMHGHETILLVEDEPALLTLTGAMLERLGYSVLPAPTPGEAIRLARENAGEIHLLMTDLVMPEMSGRDLAKNLTLLFPDLKQLFMSGYTSDVIAHHGVLEEGMHFIQKPFSMQDLAASVREALFNIQ